MPAKLIDDADTLRVTKEGKWDTGGGSPHDFNGTLSSTSIVGNSITVTFSGAHILVFGRFDTTSEAAVTNYSIDGAPPAQVTTPASVGDIPLLRQMFFIQKGLAPGPHTLRITMHKIRWGTIWFDYFQVDNNNTDIPTVRQWNLTGWPQPPPTSVRGHSSHLSNGAIVGVVNACLFILLGAATLLMWKRMRGDRSMTPRDETRNSNIMRSLIQPFIISQRAPNELVTSSNLAEVNSTERLPFDPTRFVREPSVGGHHKSTTRDQGRDSGLHAARSRSASAGGSSSGMSSNALPPGAQPPALFNSMSSPTLDRRRLGGDVPDGEEGVNSSTGSPTREMDSGVRGPRVLFAGQQGAELPPVYSPT